jgi:flavin reductase (DIM6/NTAB) family NADH-FMN oxidoreductase RutF
MNRERIEFKEFNLNIFQDWNNGWYLLTCGDFSAGQFNTMTVSWGAMGVMWGKPFVQVVVRPTRYTYQFMEEYPTFTLSAFSKKYLNALNLLGMKSGRQGDKIAESKLTPAASIQVAAPGFVEADLVIECQKMYFDDLEPSHFKAGHIAPHYNEDYHRVYYGEIIGIHGIEKYRRKLA